MVGPGGAGRLVANLDESFGGVLPDRLQEPVAERLARVLDQDQAPVHQRTEQVGEVEHLDAAGAAYPLDGGQVETAGKYRQQPQ